MITKDRRAPRDKRHHRLRRWVRGTAARPRLAVFRSLNHIYAQVIDDDAGRTLVAADSRSKEFRAGQPSGRQRGRRQGGGHRCWPSRPRRRASRAWCSTAAAIKYHGRVKALADAARAGGLEF